MSGVRNSSYNLKDMIFNDHIDPKLTREEPSIVQSMWKHNVRKTTNAEMLFGDLWVKAEVGPKSKNMDVNMQIKSQITNFLIEEENKLRNKNKKIAMNKNETEESGHIYLV